MSRPISDKRSRLVAAAMERFHHQGYADTSLADVARTAGLSAGNVFYYFRTKEDLALAVVDAWCHSLSDDLDEIMAAEPDNWQRLDRFVQQAEAGSEGYVSLGCPLAGLARDLRRESDALRAEISRVYAVQHDWLRARFVDLGFDPDTAKAKAWSLMAGYNGAILLAYAQDDPTLIESGVAALRDMLSQMRSDLAEDAR